MEQAPKKIDVRSKGVRNDYEVVERFVELLHEGFDGGRSPSEEAEFEAIRKELGYTAYAARELYHLKNKVDRAKTCELPWKYIGSAHDRFLIDQVAREVRRQQRDELYNLPPTQNFDCSLTFGEYCVVFAVLGVLGLGLWSIGSGLYHLASSCL